MPLFRRRSFREPRRRGLAKDNSLRLSSSSMSPTSMEEHNRTIQRQFVEASLEGDLKVVQQLLYHPIVDLNGLHDGRAHYAPSSNNDVFFASSFSCSACSALTNSRKSGGGRPRVWKVWHPITALQAACKAGHLEVVAFLANHATADLNVSHFASSRKDECDGSPLCHAARHGHDHIVRYLLGVSSQHQKQPYHSRDVKKVVDVNQVTNLWGSALHQAARNGHVKVLNSFVDYELKHPNSIHWNLSHFAEQGKTPLHVAVQHERTDVVDLLLSQANVDVNVQDYHGCTPLQYAITGRNLELVTLFLAHPDIQVNLCNAVGNAPIHSTIMDTKGGTPTNTNNNTNTLFTRDRRSTTTTSVARPPAPTGTTVAILQALATHPSLQLNIKNREGQNPLHMAVLLQCPAPILECLLKLATPQPSSQEPGESDNFVNAVDDHGNTPLHHAWKYKHIPAIKCLVRHPAIDLNVRFPQGWSILHSLTTHLQHVECPTNAPEDLVNEENARADDDDDDNNNREGEEQTAEVVELTGVFKFLLMQPTLDINAQDEDGDTALHMATLCSSRFVQRSLIRHPRTDVSIKNNQGQTICDILLLESQKNATVDEEMVQDMHIAVSAQLSKSLDLVLEDLNMANDDSTGLEEEGTADTQWQEQDETESLRLLAGDALGVVSLWLEEIRQFHQQRFALSCTANN